jgi:hypothetical protein
MLDPNKDDDLQIEHATSPDDTLDWCRNLIRTLADGAVWGIPRSGVAFKIDKKNQRLIQVVGDKHDTDVTATRIVFRQIGWAVVTQADIAENN